MSASEFEQLVELTYRMKDLFDFEARALCFLPGKLFRRTGEIAHMKETRVGWSRRMVVIPLRKSTTEVHEMFGICRQVAA